MNQQHQHQSTGCLYHASLYLNINRIGPRMILKENSAVAVVTELSCTFDWQINRTLLFQCCFLLCGYFSYQFDLYIQLSNIHLKLKTVCGDSGCCSKSCCTTECHLQFTIKYTLYLSQIFVNVHNDFIPGWKIVYLSTQRLSFCLYLIIAIGCAFSFHLLCFVKHRSSNSSMQLC